MNLPTNMPLTMSSLEIAGLTGKRHSDVIRDVRKMLKELDINERNFASVYVDAKGQERISFNLPKRESLILVSGYNIKMRATIIDRWQQLESIIAAVATPTNELDTDMRKVIGGIVKAVVHKEITEIIPSLVTSELASRSMLFRAGRTAGAIWSANGLPRLKGAAVWFGNRLSEMGCQIENGGRADIGGRAVRLFDPDRAAVCLKNGLMMTAKNYATERQGQKRLSLVQR